MEPLVISCRQGALHGNIGTLMLRRFAALPSTVRTCRRFIRAFLRESEAPELEYDVLVCTSELVTNAINAMVEADGAVEPQSDHGQAFVVLLAIITDRSLRIEVWDSSFALPVVENAAIDDEHGRGLAVIEACSDRWGSEVPVATSTRGPCKVTWCEWDLGVSPGDPPCSCR